MFFADSGPSGKGPNDDDVAAERQRWRDTVHAGANIKQKVGAHGRGAEKSTNKLNESSSEAMRVAERAIELLEKSKKRR
jgi:hypothetical protein